MSRCSIARTPRISFTAQFVRDIDGPRYSTAKRTHRYEARRGHSRGYNWSTWTIAVVLTDRCRNLGYTYNDHKLRPRASSLSHHYCIHSFFGEFYGAFQTPAFGRRSPMDQPGYLVHERQSDFCQRISRRISSTETETEILDQVGTYGRQLGQIADAMIVLLRYLPDRESLTRKRVR